MLLKVIQCIFSDLGDLDLIFLRDCGTLQDKSADAISDEELLSQFRKIEKLPDDKKKLVKEFLDAFIFKVDLQKQ